MFRPSFDSYSWDAEKGSSRKLTISSPFCSLFTGVPRAIVFSETQRLRGMKRGPGHLRPAAFYSSTPKRRGRSVRSNWAVSV